MDDLPAGLLVDDLEPYRSDWWALSLLQMRRGRLPPLPMAAVRPRSTEDVAQVLRWAAEKKATVVPRGGGSGVCGAVNPTSEAIVVDLTRMDRLLEIDHESLMFTAQAGIGGPKIEQELGARGMTLGHVPQSFHLSTLGGWISTKASGQLSTRYGGIEDRLLGLTAVLSDGTIVASNPSPRSSTGPDWWRMFVGAEGTLGIVTEATLSAYPLPEASQWVGVSVQTFPDGLELLRKIVQSGARPSVARLYDEADAAINFGRLGITSPTVILRFEGNPAVVEAEVRISEGCIDKAGGEMIGREAGEHWWEHRFRAVETYRQILAGEGPLGPLGVVDTMEVAHFWAGLPNLYRRVRDALSEHADAVLGHASHLYMPGANIYFTFLISSASDHNDAEARYRAAWEAGMRATLSAGGTISHHHGIGLLKSPWMSDELGSGMEAIRRLKKALDPEAILNPGKLGL